MKRFVQKVSGLVALRLIILIFRLMPWKNLVMSCSTDNYDADQTTQLHTLVVTLTLIQLSCTCNFSKIMTRQTMDLSRLVRITWSLARGKAQKPEVRSRVHNETNRWKITL